MKIQAPNQTDSQNADKRSISGKDFDDAQGNPQRALYVAVGDTDSATFRPGGLMNSGRHQEVSISDSGWTALPSSPLSGRHQINIQNFSGYEVKINADNSVSGYIGMRIPDSNERFYQVTDSIVLYAKAESGAGSIVIDVEELA